MNTTLNINRLGLLLKRYFMENKQRELTFWGIAIVVFMIIHHTEGSVEMFMYIAGFIFAASSFKIFSYTPGGMHYLLIPATHIEKLIVNIILSIFYFFIMILITYIIGTIVGTALGNIIFETNNPITFELFNDNILNQFNNHQINPFGFYEMFLTFALIQSIFLLGSIYFKRNAIGKTLLTFIALSFLLGIIEIIILKLSFGTYHFNGHMFNLTIPANKNLFPGFETVVTIFKYALIPFFWVVSYFRLTEKEV